jgi:hypothetical protein
VNGRKTVGRGTGLWRNRVMVVIPQASRETSVNQAGAQAVLFAWFFRSAFIGHGRLPVSVRNPRGVKTPANG